MPIRFDAARWDRIRETYARWWAGELRRPLVHVTLRGADPGRPEPDLPARGFVPQHVPGVPAERIVDRWDYDLSCQRFLGDAFPSVWPNFGPGVCAAFLGADLVADAATCWFRPPAVLDPEDLRLRFDDSGFWYRRVADLCRLSVERWQGQVQVGMTDLGGNLDIVSTFRPNELLLLDLVDRPAEVKRLVWEAHRVWWRYFEALDAILRPANPGYTAWAPLFSAEPFYMLQCDFSYMIGPEMFDEFVRPELQASCQSLRHAFYHLDGIGQLPHLDSLLAIRELRGVQWVPGAGRPGPTAWPEVYRKIRAAGKLVQLWGDMETLDTLVGQLGSAEGLLIFSSAHVRDEAAAREFVAKYGAGEGH